MLDADFAADSDGISDIANNHLYTGRERGAETGLQLNRQRYYASHLGRWLTRNPIGCDGYDFNLYGHVMGVPTFHANPFGELNQKKVPDTNGT